MNSYFEKSLKFDRKLYNFVSVVLVLLDPFRGIGARRETPQDLYIRLCLQLQSSFKQDNEQQT